MVFLDIPTLQQPEAYIGNAATLFDAHGDITNDTTREFLRKIMNTFSDWVTRNSSKNL
jgi:chromate reductase, NAD(P)H dehydrogenase (quinone)